MLYSSTEIGQIVSVLSVWYDTY
ncbi:hypothetical protein ACQ27_gp016 [Klebsiella phage K64-1]|nr:hypothetical protein ACQ27_gp016 [Klebsiella phage K64-1]